MSATAFKNVVRRREHYERSQPAARSKFGLLEKHKDYVARARNYHDKEKRIGFLKRKAANRNPDEFYHKMQSSSTRVGGPAGGRGGEGERAEASTAASVHGCRWLRARLPPARASPQDGKHAAQSERPKLTGDMLQLLKTQDLAYIQAKKSSEDHVRVWPAGVAR